MRSAQARRNQYWPQTFHRDFCCRRDAQYLTLRRTMKSPQTYASFWLDVETTEAWSR